MPRICLRGGVVISGKAERIDEKDWGGSLYRTAEIQTKPADIKAAPYYAWCNREPGEMRVWINQSR
ncbi:hypothetical protein [Bacillus swezeyi]|uniref:Non-reducing end beta-L-arabinofuranosidase-like GH127 C-terminal domain-containing protein n=1 Tax=Bacillus swezeyi TaxID=1925020 RepID=A0A5M8RZT1_9BACI|nr:hypothetical protein [Bacillus swezeyi]KAA6453241.1 hypothetical protein DX927_03290 [Bacillus swezeyi]TYS38611.1 hypothetical protein FZC77_03175 [Bacillus swezeyi]